MIQNNGCASDLSEKDVGIETGVLIKPLITALLGRVVEIAGDHIRIGKILGENIRRLDPGILHHPFHPAIKVHKGSATPETVKEPLLGVRIVDLSD